ncbi:MAG: precorrin-4 C(11)-methyltransferase [Armatimonadota bacterium]
MITFVGAGPGDPELITVKGRRALQEADLVLYAGSLVPTALLQWTRAECYDSAGMHLEAQVKLMADAYRAGKRVVRLHTGDPSLYGAIGEQMAALDTLEIPYQVIPGVSSFLAAAAALPTELTLPGVSQTVIITRCASRTPVPAGQEIEALAAHGATMAIFLSAGRLEETVASLRTHYPAATPAAIVQRASWPEQKIVRGTLANIAMLAEGIDRTAMILVGDVLANEGDASRLYDRTFAHGYREAERDV